MSKTSEWILKLTDQISGTARNITSASDSLNRSLHESTSLVEKIGQSGESASGRFAKLGQSMMYANQAVDAVNKIGEAFNDLAAPGLRFESSVAEMSAITNTTGKDLENLSDKARETAIAFGTDASASMDIYTKLLSKLGPELVKSPKALDVMTRNVLTLSKSMRGDTESAVLSLTSGLNQFGISIKNPTAAAAEMTKQMNIMAAAAQVGSADVTDVYRAVEQVGRVAMNAGVSFSEMNAAIQILDPGGKKASEAGVALRNMLIKLQAPSAIAAKSLEKAHVNMNILASTTIPLTDRLRELNKVFYNATIMNNLFGGENISAAQTLIQNASAIDDVNQKIQNTSSATQQAGIIMDTTAEKIARQKSAVDDLKISFFNLTGGASVYINTGMQVVTSLAVTGLAITGVTQLLGTFKWAWGLLAISSRASSAIITTSILGIPIIGWIAGAINLLGILGVSMYNWSATTRGALFGIWEFLKSFVVGGIKLLGEWYKMILTVMNPANWFDGDASAAIKKFGKAAHDIGVSAATSYARGRQQGIDSYNESKKGQKGKDESSALIPATGGDAGNATKIKKPTGNAFGGNGGGKESSTGIGGSGGGGQVRNITMNVTFTNHFHAGDMRAISDRVMQQITAVLTDSVTLADS